MRSRYAPRWKRILARICPFLFWRCPGGGLHWRWDNRVCYHRVGEDRDEWHGGILVDGREYVPLADRQAWHPVMVRFLDKYNDMMAMKVGRSVCPKVVSAENVAHAILAVENAAQAARKFLGGPSLVSATSPRDKSVATTDLSRRSPGAKPERTPT